ncbi:hypothetical protein POM88_048728 [Heracleum sosnowskyi]|uniref:RNase H type-1 domain-containing protein n=1 Tax=Heracleum sosnowskyi TaxID=360622 RepID=A0AAD8M0W5_9APIA|nr:hypothetical protein POM88_048728 [Heracleum sosnowskyi]
MDYDHEFKNPKSSQAGVERNNAGVSYGNQTKFQENTDLAGTFKDTVEGNLVSNFGNGPGNGSDMDELSGLDIEERKHKRNGLESGSVKGVDNVSHQTGLGLSTEGISNAIDEAAGRGSIHGCRISNDAPEEWKRARVGDGGDNRKGRETTDIKNVGWKKHADGMLKVNVDASFQPGASAITVGMVLRDSLSWVISRHDMMEVTLETDSLLTVNVIAGKKNYRLEVGHVVHHCQAILQEYTNVSIFHVRRHANRVAH